MKDEDTGHWIDGQRIVERIRSFDPDALNELYRYFNQTVRFLFFRGLSREDAEDALHDTFLVVLAAIRDDKIFDYSRLPGYIRTIARRKAARMLQGKSRDRTVLEPLDIDSQVAVLDSNQHERLLAKEHRRIAHEILQKLSWRDRALISRYYYWGHTREQICKDLDLSETQFRIGKNRAKMRFSIAFADSLGHHAPGAPESTPG